MSEAFIHPLAHVQDSTLGQGTRVWQFASIIRGASLGDNCNVASGTTIDGARLGNRCIVGHNCSINPGIEIGDDVFIGPGVIFCNDGWPRVDKEGFDIEALINGDLITTVIENGASIGARALILPGVRVGKDSMIGGGVIVDRVVPPGCVMWRNGTTSPISNTEHLRMRPVR